jgi:hypothetical protein
LPLLRRLVVHLPRSLGAHCRLRHGQAAPVVIAVVIVLVIAAADFSPRIVREDVPSPRNPSLGLHPSRIAQDAV